MQKHEKKISQRPEIPTCDRSSLWNKLPLQRSLLHSLWPGDQNPELGFGENVSNKRNARVDVREANLLMIRGLQLHGIPFDDLMSGSLILDQQCQLLGILGVRLGGNQD